MIGLTGGADFEAGLLRALGRSSFVPMAVEGFPASFVRLSPHLLVANNDVEVAAQKQTRKNAKSKKMAVM